MVFPAEEGFQNQWGVMIMIELDEVLKTIKTKQHTNFSHHSETFLVVRAAAANKN